MADRRFTVQPGDQIIITVPARKRSAVIGSSASGTKGIIPPRRPDEYLPRRLNKKSLINFYDLDRIKNLDTGLYDRLPFVVQGNLQGSFDYDYYISRDETFTHAVSLTRDQLFFNVPLNEWKNRFYRIELNAAARYQIKISTSLFEAITYAEGVTGSTADGLVLQPVDLSKDGFSLTNKIASIPSGNYYAFFPEIRLKDLTYTIFGTPQALPRNHITEIYNYLAPESDFVISSAMDIFLVPAVCENVAAKQTPNTNDLYLFNYNYQSFPRSAFLDSTSPYYGLDPVNADHPNAPAFFRDELMASRAFYTSDIGDAPYTQTSLANLTFDENQYRRTQLDLIGRLDPQGKPYLLAVINKSGKWFYVWSNFRA